MRTKVMQNPLAGRWFSADASELKSAIKELQPGKIEKAAGVCAVIVPHAGYQFSGRVAMQVYTALNPADYDRVVIMAPSHYAGLYNKVSMPDAQRLSSPLGELEVDQQFAARLRKNSALTFLPQAHTREHSDQIQIPLLQTVFGSKIKVVSMVVGQFERQAARDFGYFLKEIVDERTLVVVSTDFVHYGENFSYVPFKGPDVAGKIEELDMAVFERFADLDYNGFWEIIERTGATVCGRNPLAILLAMVPENAKIEKVAYDTSGRMLNDWDNSVSYLGAHIKGKWDMKNNKHEISAQEAVFSKEECRDLLKLARDSLTYAVHQGKAPELKSLDMKLTPAMKKEMGVFVTLNIGNNLRGCIGEIFPKREFWRVVLDQAVNAGLNDIRFSPVTARELDRISIEISALTPPRAVASYNEIVVGRHGIVLSKSGRSAVFLPQVAPEQGWDLATTLSHLAMKAGLRPDAWQDGAEFLVFEAQVFGEHE